MRMKDGDKEGRIKNIDWLSSVWRITTVNPELESFKFGTPTTHIAPFPEELAYRLISLYSSAGDWILDPFCGSGTTNYIALGLNRNAVGYDVEPRYLAIAKKRCEGRGLLFCKTSESMDEVSPSSVQLCLTSPPYLNARIYSGDPANIGNIRNPYPTLRGVFEEVYRVLKPNGFFCLDVAGVAEKGYLLTFPFDMIYICKDIGFRLRSSIIWDKGIILREWNLENREIAENHEYIWVFRK